MAPSVIPAELVAEKLTGQVDRLYIQEPDFSAGVLVTESGHRAKFRGRFHAKEGEMISATGRWAVHPKYGRQFEVQAICYDLPDDPDGLIRYLAGHKAFAGIGEATARKLVAYAGSRKRLDVLIRNGIDDLRAALHIPLATLGTLREAWIKHAAENETRSFLAVYELTPHQMDVLLDRFGPNVVGLLRDNPYLLIAEVRGYGFRKVDDIARKLGIAKSHPGRIRAGLLYCVQAEIGDGHTWISAQDLLAKAEALLCLDTLDSRDRIREVAKTLVAEKVLVADGEAITLPVMWESERKIGKALGGAKLLDDILAESGNPDLEITPASSQLNAQQQQAYAQGLRQRLSVISGGAGVGKTFVLGQLAKKWLADERRICLCAPTGKAAKRIEEVLRTKYGLPGIEAQTIHRLLGYDGQMFHEEQIDADAILVDEVSMTDVPLMAELFKRIDLAKTQVVLVGDHNQLPPVGPGNVLRDIISHRLAPTTVLTEVVRNAGSIERAANQILQGSVPQTNPAEPEWTVVDNFRDSLQIQAYLRDLVLQTIPRQFGYSPLSDVQIITPTHKGPLGTQAINQMMQCLIQRKINQFDNELRQKSTRQAGCLNADGELPSKGRGRRFFVGDKVIQTANDYELGVMNGTIGRVGIVDPDSIQVVFDGEGTKTIDREKQGNLQLAYAITAHKAEGSEFPCVIVLCHKSHYFADRNWLYTAVTRAAKQVFVLGDRWGLRNAAKKNEVRSRRTLLALWAERSAGAAISTKVTPQ